MGVTVEYPEDTSNYRNQRGLIRVHKRDYSGTNRELIRCIDSRYLQEQRSIKGTKEELKRSYSGSTTIDTNPNPDISCPNLFSEFWQAYPIQVNEVAAKKAWAKIKNPSATLPLILSALSRQKNSEQWQQENGKYIPYPATYLNERRWNDVPSQQIPRPHKPEVVL
jgi:post-segregation antitoxin (ccd killing protein)